MSTTQMKPGKPFFARALLMASMTSSHSALGAASPLSLQKRSLWASLFFSLTGTRLSSCCGFSGPLVLLDF